MTDPLSQQQAVDVCREIHDKHEAMVIRMIEDEIDLTMSREAMEESSRDGTISLADLMAELVDERKGVMRLAHALNLRGNGVHDD